MKTTAAIALRHLVFFDLDMLLPVATAEQCERFMLNLGIAKDDGRLLSMRVTPDVSASVLKGVSLADAEIWLNKRYGERLADVPGFYSRGEGKPFRINLPERCGLIFYGDRYASFGMRPEYFKGLLCQPLDRRDTFFLLSSAKYGGPKAAPLTPADQLFYTQYEDRMQEAA